MKSVDALSNGVSLVNAINISGPPPHELKLRVAAPTMLLRTTGTATATEQIMQGK